MPSYADVICGRLLLREKLAPAEALFAALHEMKDALERGAEMSLAEALERRAVVPRDTIARVRDATPKVQHLEAEKALARLAVDEGIATPEVVRSLVEESRLGGFKDGLGVLLQQRGLLVEERARQLFQTRQVALAEARARREGALAELVRTLAPRFSPGERSRLGVVFDVDDSVPRTTSGPITQALARPSAVLPPSPVLAVSDSVSVSRQLLASASIEPKPLAQRAEDCPIYGYEILAELGKGAMGVVYKARHIFTDRLTALKILPLKLARDSHYLERFKREAIAAMRLQHENVVRAYDFGGSEEYYYLALEFVEGETLEKRLEREGRLSEEVALGTVRQIALALGEASKQGIVHRDVKPENILITKEGTAKLCDFGIVKLLDRDEGAVTVAGTTVGTPFYIAPEQARGEEDLDTRTDLYALGITLFHLVTGRVPFTGKSQGAILVKHILEEVPDPRTVLPEVSEGCALIVRKLTRKKRDDRYPTPADLIGDIDRALAPSRQANPA
jgi:serine/threonine-protein kinase